MGTMDALTPSVTDLGAERAFAVGLPSQLRSERVGGSEVDARQRPYHDEEESAEANSAMKILIQALPITSSRDHDLIHLQPDVLLLPSIEGLLGEAHFANHFPTLTA